VHVGRDAGRADFELVVDSDVDTQVRVHRGGSSGSQLDVHQTTDPTAGRLMRNNQPRTGD
jgi:hypothetical protein